MGTTHSVIYRYPAASGITTTAIEANLTTFIGLSPSAVITSSLTVDGNGDLLLTIIYVA